MNQLIEGVRQFQNEVLPKRREEFARLADGQSPRTLFITCSDSRIDPALLTQSEPGELFVIRNAGNIVPPHGASGEGSGGEGPTIEYAVAALGVSDIVVCGHSHCGAMKGLLHPEAVAELPLVASWLRQAESTRRLIAERVEEKSGAPTEEQDDHSLLTFAVESNVLMQIENLQTYPAVADALAENKVSLHGWVYHIESGHVDVYDPTAARFVSLTGDPASTPAHSTASIPADSALGSASA